MDQGLPGSSSGAPSGLPVRLETCFVVLSQLVALVLVAHTRAYIWIHQSCRGRLRIMSSIRATARLAPLFLFPLPLLFLSAPVRRVVCAT